MNSNHMMVFYVFLHNYPPWRVVQFRREVRDFASYLGYERTERQLQWQRQRHQCKSMVTLPWHLGMAGEGGSIAWFRCYQCRWPWHLTTLGLDTTLQYCVQNILKRLNLLFNLAPSHYQPRPGLSTVSTKILFATVHFLLNFFFSSLWLSVDNHDPLFGLGHFYYSFCGCLVLPINSKSISWKWPITNYVSSANRRSSANRCLFLF